MLNSGKQNCQGILGSLFFEQFLLHIVFINVKNTVWIGLLILRQVYLYLLHS